MVGREPSGSPVRWRIVLVPPGDGLFCTIQVRLLSNFRLPLKKLPACISGQPWWTNLAEYHLGSFLREAIRCLIYFNNYCCVGLKARCEKRGWSSRVSLKSSFSSRKGQHLSLVCFTVTIVPLPCRSDLHIGNWTRVVAEATLQTNLGRI